MSDTRGAYREFWTAGGLRDVDRAILRRSLDIDDGAPATESPALVILCGLPGTGKSHFARRLAGAAPFVWVNSDRTRKLLVDKPEYTREEHRRVFAAMHAAIYDLLKAGKSVVFDATNLNEEVRRPVYAVAAAVQIEPVLVRFTANRRLVRRRLAARSSGLADDAHSDADWRIYARMAAADQSIPRPHLLVRGPDDADRVFSELLRRIG